MFWPDWWVYIVMAAVIFFGCLLFNYIMNKVNEAQLEERLNALQTKSPQGRVIQVHGPLLETGEATHNRYPTINKSEPHEVTTLKRGKDNIPISESQIEKIITKPIFLGSIYRSSEWIERRSSNGDIGKTNENESSQSDEHYYKYILNDLLDRVIAISNSNVSLQTGVMKKLRSGKSSSDANILYTRVPTVTINYSIIFDELLDNVMTKINTNN